MRVQERYFAEVFDATYVDLLRFVARRVDRAEAEDVVAEAFAIAWRRADALPSELGQARAWIFGIARKLVLADHRRGRIAAVSPLDGEVSTDGHEDTVVALAALSQAWNQLSLRHQETLSLTAWDGLTGAEAAAVLRISPVAYRIRLSRARRALSARLRAIEHATPIALIGTEEMSQQ